MPRARAYNKPRGRMTAYAFFVQTCREEHKKKHPDENVVFAAFSKKCAERWNVSALLSDLSILLKQLFSFNLFVFSNDNSYSAQRSSARISDNWQEQCFESTTDSCYIFHVSLAAYSLLANPLNPVCVLYRRSVVLYSGNTFVYHWKEVSRP